MSYMPPAVRNGYWYQLISLLLMVVLAAGAGEAYKRNNAASYELGLYMWLWAFGVFNFVWYIRYNREQLIKKRRQQDENQN